MSKLVAPRPDDRTLWRQLLACAHPDAGGSAVLLTWAPKKSLCDCERHKLWLDKAQLIAQIIREDDAEKWEKMSILRTIDFAGNGLSIEQNPSSGLSIFASFPNPKFRTYKEDH
jgi:hypothetical protein